MKKIILFIALLIAAGLTAINAQDTWTQKADFGGEARWGAVGFSVGGKGYIGSGVNTQPLALYVDFWEYDPATNAWSQKADFGGGYKYDAVGFSINDKGYVGAGQFNYQEFWEYNPTTNTWTRKADFVGDYRSGAVGLSIGGKGYIGMGYDDVTTPNYKHDFWEYDPELNTWSRKADLEGAELNYAAGFSIADKGYIGTGYSNHYGYQKIFWEYDPSLNQWNQKADYGGSGTYQATGFSIGNEGYIVSTSSEFWAYNPSANQWSQKADFGGQPRNRPVAFNINDKGYVGTGGYLAPYPFKDFWEYTPENSGIPVITSFSPTSGPVGTTVIITGNNFSSTPADNIVYSGATKATVTNASTTSLKVTVPIGATYQPITVTVNNLTAYSAQPFIVTFEGGGSAFTSTSFAPKVDIELGYNPDGFNVGDFDGDGKTDMVSGDFSTSNISVFRNLSSNGNISFAPRIDYSTGGVVYSCAIGDIDGDGKLDIVTGNYDANTVSVFRNTSTVGIISFASKVDFATGPGTAHEVIGDLDGDGKPEIIIANDPTAAFSVLRNTSTAGTISFEPKKDFVTSAGVFMCAIGDLNGDGKPDIVTGGEGPSNKFSVFQNTSTIGNISFAASIDYTTYSDRKGVAIGDLDGDGKPDLAISNFNNPANSLSVFRNTSSGGAISFAPKVDYSSGGTGSDVVSINDLDGDGRLDLILNNYWNSNISLFRNLGSIGNISFATKVDYPTGSGPRWFYGCDIDGDGKPDIALDNLFSQTISVLRNEITTGTTCEVPSGLTTLKTNSTSAQLDWNDVATVPGYVVHYKVTGTQGWISKPFLTSSGKIKDLLPGTNYTWSVKTFCSVDAPGVSSDWASNQTFTTDALRLADEQPTTLNVYPNPTSGQFKIAITLSDEKTSSAIIQVINSLGQIMYNEKTSIGNGMLLQEINLKDLPAGMYLVKVIVNDQVYSAPINFQK